MDIMDILDNFDKLSLRESASTHQTAVNHGSNSNTAKKPAPLNAFSIRAECVQMCPSEEANMRIKNKLVNVCEKRLIK